MNSTQTSKTIQIIRFSRLLLHIFSGLFQSIAYPYFSRSRQRYIARKWARNLLEILNIKLSRSGALPPEDKQRVILIANHISWLDIIIILALYPVRFVAKTEILSWPLLNILCHRAGTIFIEREKRNDTRRVNQHIGEALGAGDSVAIFPEGKTSDGTTLLHFHASLLQSAVTMQAMLYPVAIKYRDMTGAHNANIAYVDSTIVESLKLILKQPVIKAELYFLDPISCTGKNRRELARLSEHAIAEMLQLPVVRKVPEKLSGLPSE
ncbi:lysophospholipid acyltransferase family protein [Nitrosomonas communis]|uniref:1-acyl-sn-glycerol-3-phosphate acyltransferase n=1 Tax=Nitrosomonas communis TaxID=44574 RepID=A0A1I4QG11_9PROT|nr:lysophospholipid acyltransferase family protein [Nitrosomonas communis]SFM38998.1 1-acyl-sn-glycerol-3-phosphate acyltransferase [Nitrosomonas communis]